MKQRLAIAIGGLPVGGAENMVCQLATHIDKEKFEIKVFCVGEKRDTHLEREILNAGIPVQFCNLSGHVTLKKLFTFAKELGKYGPDIIHTHIDGAIYSYLYVLTHSVKMVHTLHTAPDAEFKPWIRKLMKLLYRCNKAVLVTVSAENRKLAQSMYGLRATQVYLINNGVDVDRYYHTPHDAFTFINIGRQDINKNQELIVSALHEVLKMHDCKLVLVGDGNQHNYLIQLSEKLGIAEHVCFPGMVSDGEKYLAMADVYIQSSHREGLPLSVVEAMAASLPVISTDVGGMKDLVKDNGYLIKDNDMGELVQAMCAMIEKKVEIEQMGKASHRLAQFYSSKKMADSYCDIYSKCIPGGSGE